MPVDWWFIYKMPNGFQFAYRDSNSKESVPLKLSSQFLNRTDTGALGSTLHPVYLSKDSDLIAYLLWNDEDPRGKKTSTLAHDKGVLASTATSGFWLIHSVPRFPDLDAVHFTWNASTIYGQSFLCISLAASEVNRVANLLQYFAPQLFEYNLPSSIAPVLPNFESVILKKWLQEKQISTVTSLGGQKFTLFGKSAQWNDDVYEKMVQPTLQADFLWETWRRPPAMDSECPAGGFRSLNVNSILLPRDDLEFPFTRDHSKWGVSTPESGKTWVCVGGINRMTSQRKRGGGTACLDSPTLWKGLHPLVADVENCAAQANPQPALTVAAETSVPKALSLEARPGAEKATAMAQRLRARARSCAGDKPCVQPPAAAHELK